MKILVTGAAGFIGGNFSHYLVEKYSDYQIIGLDALTYAGNLQTLESIIEKDNFKFVKGDITDRAFILDLFEKESFDVVVNFAAESHVDRSIENPEISQISELKLIANPLLYVFTVFLSFISIF